ncbi:MAG: hypothetical protein KF734_19905, partial [Saprospiraceae bacterium]|nr:hypothetical protein [Saprospiraceae bacterium]
MKNYLYSSILLQANTLTNKSSQAISWKALLFGFAALLTGKVAWGQANPTAQSLPYTQNFTALVHSSSTYPAGWQGWGLAVAASGVFRTNAPIANANLLANSTAATATGGVHNYDGKIGILSSGSIDPSIVLALNTTSKNTIRVTYDVMTIRNPYNGTTNTRINETTLQYRIGTSGDFTTLTGIEYQNNTETQTGSVTTPQNLQTKTLTLPAACNNQPVVQIRWVMRDMTGMGARPSFAVDNITVCEAPTANAGADLMTCVNGVVRLAGTVGGSATGGTWSDGGLGGTFLPNANNLNAFYIPPAGNTDTISLVLTTTGACPPQATDTVRIAYGSLPPMTLRAVAPASATCGENVTINIEVDGFVDIKSYQFAVEWDPAKFDYVSYSATIIGGVEGTVGEFQVDNGILTYGWVDPAGIAGENLADETVVLTLTLKVLANSGTDEPVNIVGTVITPIEATNSQQCFLTVNVENEAEIDINPITVTCPSPQTVCSGDAPFALSGGTPDGGDFSGNGVTNNEFDPSAANLGANTITYSYTNNDGCSNTCTFDITVNQSVATSVSISADPSNVICSGTSVTFTAVPTNGGATPSYQWKKNGADVGTDSDTYTDAGLADGDEITCEMTSSADCADPATAISNTITMTVSTTLTPSVSITANPGNTICSGTSVTFTAIPTNGGATPSYQWKKNGADVGTDSDTYVDAGLVDGDQISVVLTSSADCADPLTATSNTITMTVANNVTPSVSITANPGNTICSGTSVTFTAVPTNGGAIPSYQWKKNSLDVGTDSDTYTDAGLANGDQISVVLTSSESCANPATATSNTITMTVNATVTPSVSITANPGNTICVGTSVTFTAVPTNGGATPSYQWKKNGLNVGTDSDTYTDAGLANGDQISVVLASSALCANPLTATSNTITMTVNALATADAGLDQATCVNGIVYVVGTVGGSATGGTWDDGGAGGTFSPNANSLAIYYIPPINNANPITLTLTANGPCPATDEMEVTYNLTPSMTLRAVAPASATCGENVVISVEVDDFVDIKSYQFVLEWDPAKFDYVSYTATEIGGAEGTVGEFEVANGILTYGWVDPAGIAGENLADETVVLTLTLKVLANSGTDEPVNIVGTVITPIEATNSQQCFLTVNVENEVEIDINPITVTCPSPQTVCSGDAPFALSGGTPDGGDFSGNGVTNNEFDPSAANLGANTITYSYTNNDGCSNTCTFDITVNAQSNATCPENQSVCVDELPLDLTTLGALPVGGTFSGTGVTGNTYSAAAGTTNTVTYTYGDGNCESSCTFDITVNAQPMVTCPENQSVCVGELPLNLTTLGALPAGGTFSGMGVTGNSYSAAAGTTNTVTYTYNDGNCENSCTFDITVNAAPTCMVTGASSVCSNSTGNSFSAPAGMSMYQWGISGNGTIDGATNGQNVLVNATSAGSFTLSLTITDANGCTSTCNKVVTVSSDPLCGPPAPDAQCTPPATFDYDVVANGTINWTALLPAVSPNNVTQKIRITGTGIVNVENSDLLLKSSNAVLVVDGPELRIRNGNFKLETAGSRAIFNNAILRVSGSTQLSGSIAVMPQTSLCMTNCIVEIGDEQAGGYFSAGGVSTSADFQNDGGYRYLAYVCLNVTHDLQLSSAGNGTASGGGLDVFINVVAEIGDRGPNHAINSPFGSFDGDDSGNLQNNNTMLMYNSAFILANGNVQNQSSSTMFASETSFKLNNGSFQNSGTLNGASICLGAHQQIQQNSGSWQAGSVTTWYAGGAISGPLPFPPPAESTPAEINACIASASCTSCVDPVCSITGSDEICAGTLGNVYSGPAGMSVYAWSITGNGAINGATNAQNVTVDAGANGSFTLTLVITDADGCSSTCMKMVTVNALPMVTCPGNQSVCVDN